MRARAIAVGRSSDRILMAGTFRRDVDFGRGWCSGSIAGNLFLSIMGAPSYDAETLNEFFHSFDPALFEHPVVGATLRALAERDPDLLAAVADVDRSQIRLSLALSPLERVRVASRLWRQRTRFKRAAIASA